MWVPSETEAIEMFARHFEARHRNGAASRAEEVADGLGKTGDVKGQDIWKKVASRIEELRRTAAVTDRRRVEAA